jgi:hypothetical protein
MQDITSYIREYLSVQKLKDDEYDKQYVLFEFTSDTIHSDKVLKEKLNNYKNRIITLWSTIISGVNTDYYILTIKELRDCFSNYVKVFKNTKSVYAYKIDELYGADEKAVETYIKEHNDEDDVITKNKENRILVELHENN